MGAVDAMARDQAQIESFFGHLCEAERPHLDTIDDIATMRAELGALRHRWNTVRLHQEFGYVTPTKNTEEKATESAKPVATDSPKHADNGSLIIATTTPTPDPHIRTEASRDCHIESDRPQRRSIQTLSRRGMVWPTSRC